MTARPGRRWLNLGLLGTGTVSAVSGFLIQVRYHMGHRRLVGAADPVWGCSHATWALIHQIASVLLAGIAAWHLYPNRKALAASLVRAAAWRTQGPFLFTLFSLAVVTSLAAWFAAETGGGRLVERGFVEIHDKLVIPMSVLLVLHVWRRRARLV